MKKIVALLIVVGLLAAAGAYEWRYSSDMQAHIAMVNRELEMARMEDMVAQGLLGSLQAMKTETDVAGEIISTHEHVHTLKDEMLARKIKKAIDQDGMTVGGAIQAAIAAWPDSR